VTDPLAFTATYDQDDWISKEQIQRLERRADQVRAAMAGQPLDVWQRLWRDADQALQVLDVVRGVGNEPPEDWQGEP
jgi:hypothetical protein